MIHRFIATSLFCAALVPCAAGAIDLATQTVAVSGESFEAQVAKGFRFEAVNTGLRAPRMLTFHSDGSLFAGSRAGKVYRLEPPYATAKTLDISLDYPHSVVFRDDRIYIASTEGVYSGQYNSRNPSKVQNFTLLAALPGGSGHSSRTLKIGPDGRLYASLGITGNCSAELLDDGFPFSRQRGGVLVLDETSGSPKWDTWAKGLRNPVGFNWNPETGVMYASNNGPDHQGFEQPPEVFARLDKGTNMGMPWFQFDGQQINRDSCRPDTPPFAMKDVSSPVATFPARNAPMDVLFVPNEPKYGDLAGNALVALRGSWATRPDGGSRGDAASRRPPKLVMVRFQDGKATGVEDVITGFQMPNGQRWLRPVGLALGPDGAIYISSDSGVQGIFRLKPLDHTVSQQ